MDFVMETECRAECTEAPSHPPQVAPAAPTMAGLAFQTGSEPSAEEFSCC